MLAAMFPGMTEEQIVHKIAADQQRRAMEMQQVKQVMDAFSAGAKAGVKVMTGIKVRVHGMRGEVGGWSWMKNTFAGVTNLKKSRKA